MKFTKMQGLGNDFVLVDGLKEKLPENLGELSQKLCDRHFGVGADGLVVVLPSQAADIRMRIFNPDGSEPEMCGNVIRCFARYVYDHDIVSKQTITIETLAGIIVPELIFSADKTLNIRVDMGEPRLERSLIPMEGPPGQVVDEAIKVDGNTYKVTCVSMGNPHCITFVPNVNEVPIHDIGPQLEAHPLFPRKTNVEFIHVLNKDEVNMRVWERGAGETLACGTGACATAVACVLNGLTNRAITVHLAGGDLFIEWAENNHVYMTGPGQYVFSGEIEI
ncbi:MAG: diaminopimelate epimerase [Thermincola sp.]|jgi:diaminopimelate epimerase|nr:diaminopimelate epimerase [Thermincola sp.]MDT3704012.1 diaminopimelate epimerase [Thermincola sp.]